MTDLDDYILAHISAEPDYLARTYRETWRYRLYPRMCSGHLQGSILTMLTRMAAPRRVLEVGTYSGYSALAIASGLPSDGHLDTIEVDEEHEEFIRRRLDDSPLASRITLHIGDVGEISPRLVKEIGEWDMIYVDANKRDYPAYYRLLLPMLARGGYMLVDNTLWDGHVVDPDDHNPQTLGIRAFNDLVATDPTVEVTILPLRDGLTIIRKK